MRTRIKTLNNTKNLTNKKEYKYNIREYKDNVV